MTTPTTQTITQEINQDLVLTLHVPETSAGNILGDNSSSRASIRGLPRHRESRIANRLGALSAWGREEKIKSLIKQLQEANLSPGLRAEVDHWILLFSSIPVEQTEDRIYALSALSIRVLRPALLQVANGEKVSLDRFISISYDILQQMLPMGALEGFLEDCEQALIEERIHRVVSARLAFAGQVEMNATNNIVPELDAQIRERYEGFKRRYASLQENRRNMVDSADSEVEAVTTRVEAVGSRLLAQMTAIRDMAAGAVNPELTRSINELQSMLQRRLR